MRLFRAVVIAFAAVAPIAIGVAFGQTNDRTIPVPRITGPLPVTADSYPELAANRVQFLVDLSKAGYVEEEFLVTGTANVYDWLADGGVSVRTPNAPYTTRILIRRPTTPAKFSGNVILEAFENNRSFDWAFIWGLSNEYFIEHGDAWVGVTHNTESIAALKKFNPQRYVSLSMANPNPNEACGSAGAKSNVEAGLKYDIFSQIAAALKSAAGPMPGIQS
jgi:hypothetical protein